MINSQDPNISAAEMTAYWRSLFPQFSQDIASIQLASLAGIQKAKEFEVTFGYPLVGRKVSVRAGFMLENAVRLLSTGRYDSCISFASGFSLLTYYIAKKLENTAIKIQFIDSDLPTMAMERTNRIKPLLENTLSPAIAQGIKIIDLDLEFACKLDKSFKKLFHNCKKPLFIIEGVMYFLSQECVAWIMDNIKSYDNSAMIFDYWPKDGVFDSRCFKRVVDSLQGFIPENIKSFWDDSSIYALGNNFEIVEDYSGRVRQHIFYKF